MLIHFVSDEFLEMELNIDERVRLAEHLGLHRLDLIECTVFVTYRGKALTDEKLHANINAARARADRHSLELYDHGQIDWLNPSDQDTRCEGCADRPAGAAGLGES